MSGKTAFVTGATGFVGVNLVKELKEQGWSVVALNRRSSDLRYLEPLGATLVEGDVTDRASIERVMPEDVDVVFHVAGNLSYDSTESAEQTRDNVEGTRNVAAIALAKGAKRLVHTSSVAAFGLHEDVITEKTPSNALSLPVNYNRTKKLAEEEIDKAIKAGLDAVFVNPTGILGPYDRHGFARLIKLVHTRKLPGVGPGGTSFCHVREVARAHIAAAERGRTGERYLLGGTDASYLEFAQRIENAIGGKAPKKPLSPGLLKLLARIMPFFARLVGKKPDITPQVVVFLCGRSYVDSAKAERELGYKPVPLEQMINDSYRWLQQEGLLGPT